VDYSAGDSIGPFRIEEVIGRGGSGTVYRANDPRFGGMVAVKVLAEHLSFDSEAVEQFVREARALRKIEHESVVNVFDVASTDQGQPYMVLRLADRGTLLDRLPAQAVHDGELERLIHFLTASLGALHKQDMVHRDVKPSNVLLSSVDEPRRRTDSGFLLRPDERFLLGDLGLVKDLTTGELTRGGGTHGYAAPEQQAVVSRVDRRVDVFGASALVAEVALGRLRKPTEDWGDLLDELDRAGRPNLAAALRVGLATDPDDRYPDMASWAAEVSEADTEHTIAAGSALLASSDRARRRSLTWAVAVVAAIFVGFGVWQLGQFDGADATIRTDPPKIDASATTVDGTSTQTPTPPATVTSTPAAPPTPLPLIPVAPPVEDPTPTPTPSKTPEPDSAADSENSDDGSEDAATAASLETSAQPDDERTPTAGPTTFPTSTTTPTPTATATTTATATATPTSTATPTATPSATATPVPDPRSENCPRFQDGVLAVQIVDQTATSLTIEYPVPDVPTRLYLLPRWIDNVPPTSNRYVIENLTPDSSYTVRLAVRNESSDQGTTICGTTQAANSQAIPVGVAQPLNLTRTDTAADTATFSWDPPATGAGAYTVYIGFLPDGKNFPTLVDAEYKFPDQLTHTVEGLSSGEQFVFGIRARNGENVSGLTWNEFTQP